MIPQGITSGCEESSHEYPSSQGLKVSEMVIQINTRIAAHPLGKGIRKKESLFIWA